MRGHVRKRGSRWSVVVELPRDPDTGKRRQQWRSAATRAEADRLLTRLLAEQDGGVVLARSKLTLAEQVEDWLATDGMDLRPTSRSAYRRSYRSLVKPHLGGHKVEQVTPQVLTRWLARLRGQGKAPSTILVALTVVRNALGQAVRHGQLARNPADSVQAPSRRTLRRPALDPAQTRTLFGLLAGDRHEALYLTVLGSGIRKGEALGLRWQDVSLPGASLAVVRQKQRTQDEGVYYDEPKTEAGRRVIALPAFAVAALKAHRARQNAERLELGELWEDHDLVFPKPGGGPLPTPTLDRHYAVVQAACVAAGLPRFTFHALRHLHASLEAQAGVAPKTLSERMGHSNVKTTMDVYVHTIPAQHRQAASALDDLLAAPPDDDAGQQAKSS